MITNMTRRVGPLALALAILALVSGCASPARSDQMTVGSSLATRTTLAASPLANNLAVADVTGGKDTNPMWVSNVSSSDFERALEASLRDAGLLSTNRQGGTHTITAHLLKLDQPLMGASMTVTASVQYAVVERRSGKTVYERTITLPYTAAWNASFLGSERLRLANEGAVRENLQKLVQDLAALPAASLSVR